MQAQARAQAQAQELELVYGNRFSDDEAERKDALWRVICAYLQRFVPRDGAVLDLACDRGDFIRNIVAREKWASDMRDVSRHLPAEVNFVRCDGLAIARGMAPASLDVVFMSNYLEHLPSGDAVVEQLKAATQLLRPGGRLVVLQPNIKLTGPAYWDFIDHKVALTEKSLVEAAEIAGCETERLIVRFLPFTTKGRLPASPRLARAYLAFPPAWRLLGQQTLYVGRRITA
jgi:SAM-dependent methyltransferase